ncbi:glycine receptor subunit alphaZ1-like [Glandiceps talaboti]
MRDRNPVMLSALSLLIFCCGQIYVSATSNVHELEQERMRIMDLLLTNEELSTFRPNLHGNPVDVECFLFLQNLGDMNPMSMDYTVNIDFYVSWVDERLRHNASALIFQTIESIKKFWLPDIYFVNEKEGERHSILSENIALLLQPNGNITYSTRLTLTLSCNMDFKIFPLDIQWCHLTVRSYAYNSNNVVLHWRNHSSVIWNDEITLPQYALEGSDAWVRFDDLPLGNFTTLISEFKMERSLGFFILTLFLPSILLVMISWIPFWLHVDATAARASLGITSVLTLVTQSGSLRHIIPQLSYPTAMDVWFTTCVIFVFAALIEFSMVNYFYISSLRFGRKELSLTQNIKNENETEMAADVCPSIYGSISFSEEIIGYHDSNCNGKSQSYILNQPQQPAAKSIQNTRRDVYKRRCQLLMKSAERIDKICRALFPILFGIFALCFWNIYPMIRGDTHIDFWLHTHTERRHV